MRRRGSAMIKLGRLIWSRVICGGKRWYVLQIVIDAVPMFHEFLNDLGNCGFVSVHLRQQSHHRIRDRVHRWNECFPRISLAPNDPVHRGSEISVATQQQIQHLLRLVLILIHGMKDR